MTFIKLQERFKTCEAEQRCFISLVELKDEEKDWFFNNELNSYVLIHRKFNQAKKA